jgi:hypothetical protein
MNIGNDFEKPYEIQQQVWSIRQNPWAMTDQNQMRALIISQNIITCPFGHISNERNNVLNNVYNEDHNVWKSLSQDRAFIEDIRIGDIVVIPFKGIKKCILARITSKPIYVIETGKFTKLINTKIHISDKGDTPFRPIGRKIEIINKDLFFHDKRVLPRRTLARINPSLLPFYHY